MGSFQTVSSKTNRISDTKHNISCIAFLVLQAPVWEFLSSFRVTTSAPILYGFGHLIKVLYNGTLVIELCAIFWTYMIPTYLIALCAHFSFFFFS